MSNYDYDIDVNIPTTVRLDNGNVLDLKLTSKILNDSTLDRIFQDIDDFLENEFQGGIQWWEELQVIRLCLNTLGIMEI